MFQSWYSLGLLTVNILLFADSSALIIIYSRPFGTFGSYALPTHWQFANTTATIPIKDKTTLEHLTNKAFITFNSPF